MSLILSMLYIVFILLTLFLLVRDNKNSRKNITASGNSVDKKIALIILLTTMLVYYVLGWLFNADFINAITFRKNGVTFSLLGALLLIVTSLGVGYIVDAISKKSKK